LGTAQTSKHFPSNLDEELDFLQDELDFFLHEEEEDDELEHFFLHEEEEDELEHFFLHEEEDELEHVSHEHVSDESQSFEQDEEEDETEISLEEFEQELDVSTTKDLNVSDELELHLDEDELQEGGSLQPQLLQLELDEEDEHL